MHSHQLAINQLFLEIASCTHFRWGIRLSCPSFSKFSRTHIEFASEQSEARKFNVCVSVRLCG
jgi:hypothetical protein